MVVLISTISTIPHLRPVSQAPLLATGMRVPVSDMAGLGRTKEPTAMHIRHRREKVFGPGRAVPLDRNAKARIAAYARAWSARNRQPRQKHRGPITRAFLDVLQALLWGFHNSRSGCCFPSYESIADKARCARSTVAEALKALEWAGVLTWQNRITRILVPERDLFGHVVGRWQVIRTSNAYVFHDPLQRPEGVPACKSENPTGTRNLDILDLVVAPVHDPNSPLERALARFGATIEERLALNGRARSAEAT
jgi:hypothetical protein